MKKIFTLLVALIFSLTMMTSVSAIGLTPIEDESKLYIETATVPSNVTSYAADIFMHMGKPVWANFGISDSQLSNLTLSQGFRMISVNTMQYSDIAYYFLIYAGDSVVAIMTISNVNGELGFQIERNLLTVDISEKLKNSAQPYRIYVSDNAYYFIQNNQIIHVSSDDNLSDKDSIVNDCAKITSSLSTYSDLISTAAKDINMPVASFSLGNSINYDLVGYACSVMHVDNYTYYEEDAPTIPRGVCWAACVASICYYYKNGCSGLKRLGDQEQVTDLRDNIIDERKAQNNGKRNAKISETPPFINERLPAYGYGHVNYCYRSHKISWEDAISSVINKSPSIMGWYYYDYSEGKYTKGHAMVIDGCSYVAQDPTLVQYGMLFMMNPNDKPVNIIDGIPFYPMSGVGYNDFFIINGLPFEWNRTACQDLYN